MSETYRLIVAEKPSVARDIARVLGLSGRGHGYIYGRGVRVTWCVGHLVELAEPAQYHAEWRAWRLEMLPMLPEVFRLKARKDGSDQWKIVRDLLTDGDVSEIINACDAGREGELIFGYAYQHAGGRAPVRRLWISSMTDQAIKAGFADLRPGAELEPLGDAARCRSEADWLVGLNTTRAMTTWMRKGPEGSLLSVGRVQTPTLALLDTREAQIEAFVPENFWQVRLRFGARAPKEGAFEAVWTAPATKTGEKANKGQKPVDRFTDKAKAEAVLARVADRDGAVTRAQRKEQHERPPLLYDLTNLQKEANKRFGFSAKETLEHAQALYEKHKVLTYPRTDSRHLTDDQVPGLPALVRSIAFGPYQAAAADIGERWPVPLGKRMVDDAEVSDHHAIIPTGQDPRQKRLSVAEKRVFDLVARRFLAAMMPDAVFATTRLEVTVDSPGEGDARIKDRFLARGRACLEAGWRAIDPPHSKKKEVLLPPVDVDEVLDQLGSRLHEGQTKPPKRLTEATLLAAMESAGEVIEEAELKRAMKRSGLGTPATRAAIIETLLARHYIERAGKELVPTPRGRSLLAALPVEVLRSPKLTGQWEARLALMAEGKESRERFMTDVRAFTATIITAVKAATPDPELQTRLQPSLAGGVKVADCPLCEGDFREGGRGWGCDRCGAYVPNQVARRAISLRIMKSICKERTSSVVKGFKSRAGKDFSAALHLSDSGEIEFVFPDPEPLGVCPGCGKPVRRRGKVFTCDTGRGCRFVVFSEMSGREIGQDEVSILLKRGVSEWRDGFVAGERRFGGVLRWDGQRVAVIPLDRRVAAGVICACPECSGEVRFVTGARQAAQWACQACRLRLPAEMGGRSFEPEEVVTLLSKGRTPRLHGFRQQGGAVFKAAVVREANGRLRWDYAGGADESETVIPAGGPPPAFGKRLDCPLCVADAKPHPGYVIAGRAAFGCSGWKAGCPLRVPFEVGGTRLTEEAAKRLLSKNRATKWEKGFAGHPKRARLVLIPGHDPCWQLEKK